MRRCADVGVIALVPDAWRSVWTVRHHVLSRLAGHFEVVWVEPARGWREHWLPGTSSSGIDCGEAGVPPGLTVHDHGRWSPQVYRPRVIGRWLEQNRLRAAREALISRGCTRIVLYLWRPEFDWALGAPDIDLTCYHIDDEYQFSTVEKPTDMREERLIRAADQVIVHSPALLRKKGGLNPNTIMIPNGADFHAFAAPQPEPPDLVRIPRPRIGYIGVIKTQLDLDLLLAVARRHPEWSMVLVGPRGYLGNKVALIEQLERLSNVYFLGGRPHDALPAYAQAMDVCTMCYELNDYTKYIYPLKLHEYLASGSPIVATPIEPLVPFRRFISLAGDLEAWGRAIADALAPAAMAPERVAERRRVASENDWDALVGRIARHFGQRLGMPDSVMRESGTSSARPLDVASGSGA